MPQLSTTNYEN